MLLLFITSVPCEECIFVFGCLHCRNGELGNYSFQLGFANLMIVRRGERDTLHSNLYRYFDITYQSFVIECERLRPQHFANIQ